MNVVARYVSFLALALTLVPPVFFALGMLSDPVMKNAMLAGAVLWFATAPRWMRGGGD